MRHGYNTDYSYVIDSSFQPFSMQELLTPFMMYKDAYEKSEEAYDELNRKADNFKYLSETLPEGSKARQIYEGYANELHAQAKDFSNNGLSMNNRRTLTNLKRRYHGEIGRLDAADAAMKEEQKLRRQMNAKDSSMLYADDNLSIDSFLDGKNPNLYSISGEDLRKEAAQYAQTASSRIYGNTRVEDINKYFQNIVQTQGYSPEVMAAWRQNLESIPEFNQAVEDIMSARGVNGNLTGVNYERARQSVINGIMEGAGYQEKRDVKQNPGEMTAEQRDASARGWASLKQNAAVHGMVRDSSSPTGYRYDITQDPKQAGNLWMYKIEDGKITGYSDEYLKLVKDGTITANGKPAKAKEGKAAKEKAYKPAPNPQVAYNEKGERKDAKGTTRAPINYGHKLSYAEALSKYKTAVMTHGDQYNYWENNGWIYPIPKTAEELKAEAEAKAGAPQNNNHKVR